MKNKIPCIWVDIDGTIADSLHLYEPSADDDFHNDIIHLVDLLSYHYPIVFCTGRREAHRAVTVEWLKKTSISWDALYMRTDGDDRSDTIVKIELLEEMRANGYEPWIAFEDRNRVVKVLRENGIRVLHVKDGDY